MRHLALASALIAAAILAPIVPACSSTQAAAPPADAGGDSAIGPGQFANAPCNPLLTDACLQVPCATVECDPILLVCVATPLGGPCESGDASYVLDTGTPDGTVVVVPGCESNFDCPTVPSGFEGGAPVVYVCGFSAFDGCSATGVCVTPEPPHTLDGALETACGCNGEAVAYVNDTLTASPVASATPCAVGVVDSGPDAADGGTDGGADAADGASQVNAADAAEDAASD